MGIKVDKKKSVCRWKFINDIYDYETSCDNTYSLPENYCAVDSDWKFCPFCGRKIEEVFNGN